MTWIRLDDHIRSHPKILKAGPEAAWLWVAGLSYCAEHLTDGVISVEALPTLGRFRHVERLVARLVDVGLWTATATGGGYVVHDYHDYQPMAETVRAVRAARARAGAIGGRRSGEVRRSKNEANLTQDACQMPEDHAMHAKQETSKDEARCFAMFEANANPVPIPVSTTPPIVPRTRGTRMKHNASHSRDGPVGFDAFWAVYPWHLARAAAERAWLKLNPDLPLHERLLDAIAWQRRVGCLAPRVGPDGRPIRLHPASWLNGRRWEDEQPAELVTADATAAIEAQCEQLRRDQGGFVWDGPTPVGLVDAKRRRLIP